MKWQHWPLWTCTLSETIENSCFYFFYYAKENRTSELMFSQRILSVSEGVLLVGPIKPVYDNRFVVPEIKPS